MMERFIIWKRFSLVRVLLLTGLLGCVHDKLDGPDQLGKVIDIELVIPGFEVHLTRSIEGDNRSEEHTSELRHPSSSRMPSSA